MFLLLAINKIEKVFGCDLIIELDKTPIYCLKKKKKKKRIKVQFTLEFLGLVQVFSLKNLGPLIVSIDLINLSFFVYDSVNFLFIITHIP